MTHNWGMFVCCIEDESVNVIFNQLRALDSHFVIVMHLIQRLRDGKPICTESTLQPQLTRRHFSKYAAQNKHCVYTELPLKIPQNAYKVRIFLCTL
jgi:hypothetical protein